jgi:PadR family transcriptional regulator, regulatory protein PadR
VGCRWRLVPSGADSHASQCCNRLPKVLYSPAMNSKNENKTPSLLRHFFLGFVKIHILHHAAQEPVFGLALIRELARHGYELSPGTLYPVLHELERAGYVEREDRVVDGKVRKYYRATPSGLEALDDARAKIQELVVEVLQREGPGHLPESDTPPT